MLFPCSSPQTRDSLERCNYCFVVSKTVGQSSHLKGMARNVKKPCNIRIVLQQMLKLPLLRNTAKCPRSKSKWAKCSHQVQRAREWWRRENKPKRGPARQPWAGANQAAGAGASPDAVPTACCSPHPVCGTRWVWATLKVQDKRRNRGGCHRIPGQKRLCGITFVVHLFIPTNR